MSADTLGQRIRAIRKDLQLTQQQFAERLGLAGSTVSSYELDDSLPSVDVIIKLSDIGDVSYDWLLAGCYMAKSPGGKIIQLTQQELDLLRLYRKAAPGDRETIIRVAELTIKKIEPAEK